MGFGCMPVNRLTPIEIVTSRAQISSSEKARPTPLHASPRTGAGGLTIIGGKDSNVNDNNRRRCLGGTRIIPPKTAGSKRRMELSSSNGDIRSVSRLSNLFILIR